MLLVPQHYVGLDDVEGRLGNVTKATQDAVHPVVIKHPLSGKPGTLCKWRLHSEV